MTWRGALYFVFGCVLGGYAAWANAGYALASPPSGMGFVPGVGYTWKPPVSTPPANGTWTAHGFVKHAGKNIPLPASWGVAANAGTFAKNALRFNPALFIGTTVAAIAIDAGLEYIEDEWRVLQSPAGNYEWCWRHSLDSAGCFADYTEACFARNNGSCGSNCTITGAVYPGAWGPDYADCTGSNGITYSGWASRYINPNYDPDAGTYVPATESDWNAIPVGPLTDTQLDELSRYHPQGLPVTDPVLEPVTEQIGQPYTDPVTGEQWRDMLRITPDPTASSPTRVRIDEYREPMTTPAPSPENPNPEPIPDETRPPEDLPFELPIFCDWAEIVCDLYDWFTEEVEEPPVVEVPELDLELDTESFGLPSSGSCPAPQSVSIGFGTFNLSYQPFCDLAVMIRPLVLVTAYLFAGLILLGVRR